MYVFLLFKGTQGTVVCLSFSIMTNKQDTPLSYRQELCNKHQAETQSIHRSSTPRCGVQEGAPPLDSVAILGANTVCDTQT